MKKLTEKKRIIIIVLVILLGLCSIKALDLLSYNYVKAKAVHYLCDKYDADKEEFELVDYLHSGFHEKPKGEWVDFINWHDFSFEFKYKDKDFFVNRFDGKFYDDYQIEDIETWCTDWLKQNVDKRIDSFTIETEDIVRYLNNTGKGNQYVFSSSDAKDFITKCVLDSENPKSIYIFYNEKAEKVSGVYGEVKPKMDDVFDIDSTPFLSMTSHSGGKWELSRYVGGPWEKYYF